MAGSTRQVLTSILDRTGVEPTATETVRTAVAGIGDLRRMASEYEYATRRPCRRPVPDRRRTASCRVSPPTRPGRMWRTGCTRAKPTASTPTSS